MIWNTKRILVLKTPNEKPIEIFTDTHTHTVCRIISSGTRVRRRTNAKAEEYPVDEMVLPSLTRIVNSSALLNLSNVKRSQPWVNLILLLLLFRSLSSQYTYVCLLMMPDCRRMKASVIFGEVPFSYQRDAQ